MIRRRHVLAALLLAGLSLLACRPVRTSVQRDVTAPPAESPLPSRVGRPEIPVPAPGGVVAAAHPLAAEAGAEMLRQGGTAFDAAVATALVLGVVNNQSSGLGGGGFALFRSGSGPISSLDFRETAPSFFAPDTYLAEGRDSRRGPWAVGVPGEAAGLAELHRRGGRLAWGSVVEPARRAAEGFEVNKRLADSLQHAQDAVLADPGLSADFAPAGRVLTLGETCRRPALARTLEYLQLHGGDAFYRGPLAVSMAGFLAEAGAPWTEAEFEGYEVVERQPLRGTYAGKTIWTMGPPSSGGFVLLEVLGVLERSGHRNRAFASADWLRTLAGALSHGFADRATYGGDPGFAEIPLEALLDPKLHDRLAAALPAEGPIERTAAGLAGERGASMGLVPDDGGTSHLVVLDGDGRAVSLTTTVNLGFGAAIQDPATGILFNDQMDDFTARPGEPNAFGLVQSERNQPDAGKRPLSSMTPTLVTDEQGRVVLAVGGAGGPTIITGTLLALLGVLDRQLPVDEAVAAPRIHHQWLPAPIFHEASMTAAAGGAIQVLAAEGFKLVETGRGPVVQGASFDPETGRYLGVADPRGAGGVVVLP